MHDHVERDIRYMVYDTISRVKTPNVNKKDL